MSSTGVSRSMDEQVRQLPDQTELDRIELAAAHERQAEVVRLLWNRRKLLGQAAAVGLLLSTLVAFLIPRSFTAIAQLMPPDQQSSNGLAMMAALAGKSLGGLAGMTGDLLGMKSSGALFVGVLRSETSQDRIIEQFDLKHVYGTNLLTEARKKLDDKTQIVEDRKSGIIAIRVTDRNPNRAAAIANAYVDELNSLSANLSTSAAHRERVFLEDRLKVAKRELDEAANQLAQFSSKNTTLDVQTEGKAMLDAAGSLAGQLIAAQAQLEGLRQIYTDNNPRVRALNGRVAELRHELQKFGGAPPNSDGSTTDTQNLMALKGGNAPADKFESPFPSIRKLPLLGAQYMDYYERAKIQETVFELLTEQFELAKVQEAKDTPSVKVLDPARVPETKSFPPRLVIMFSGTLLTLIVCACWVLAGRGWAGIDASDPRKVLALEIYSKFEANAPWASHNGDAPRNWAQKTWKRVSDWQRRGDSPSSLR
jgi:uncharacterized protein involved in exopolysaccharide biosynthesis